MQWGRAALAVIVTALLLTLVVANIAVRFSWVEVEDGILWEARAEGVVAASVGPEASGARAGIRAGDVLVAINGRGIDRVEQVLDAQHGSQRGRPLSYVVSRSGYERPLRLELEPVPEGARLLYYALAAVAIFALLVGCSVRVQRPQDVATLHFFWLTVAFFGVCGFSYSGRLDRLDWIFYWGDVVAMLALPPLFVHFALVFPERQDAWAKTPRARVLLPMLYLPALVLGLARISVLSAGAIPGDMLENWVVALDRAEMLQLVAALVFGQAIMTRTLGRLRSVTARRQLRWIVWGTLAGALPFALFYGLPYALGYQPWEVLGVLVVLLALVPLAFASAVVRYRLMDVEVIIKRTVVYATVLAAIATIYTITLRFASEMFLGGSEQHNSVIAILATLLVVLLAPMVKNAIQTALDYAHYRDRYDYRRALLAFARELNADLDLDRLTERLVQRLADTFGVDRITLFVASAPGAADGFAAHRAVGAALATVPALKRFSGIGTRLESGQVVSLDDPFTVRRFSADEVRFWRDHRPPLLRAVSCEGRPDCGDRARLPAERRAAQHRGPHAAQRRRRAGRHRDRERQAVPGPAREGRRAESHARVQRERRRVPAGRVAGGRPRWRRAALEPGDGADRRRRAGPGRRPSPRRAVRSRVPCRHPDGRARRHRDRDHLSDATRVAACRWRAQAAGERGDASAAHVELDARPVRC